MDLLNIYTILLSGDLESLSTLESPIPTVDLLDISPEKINQMSDESIRNTPQNLEDFINPKSGNLQRFQFGNPVNFNPVDISTQKLRSVDTPETFPLIGEVTNIGTNNRLTETPIFQDNTFDQVGVEPSASINTINNTTNTSNNNTEEKNFYFQIKLNNSPNTESTSINQNSFQEIFRDGNNFMTKLENTSTNISMLDKTNPENSIKPILDNLIIPQQNVFPSDLISTLNKNIYSVVGDVINSDETKNVVRNIFQQNNTQETINQLINSDVLQKSLDEINKITEIPNIQRNISETINELTTSNLIKTNNLTAEISNIQRNISETINELTTSNLIKTNNLTAEIPNIQRNISETINELTTSNLIKTNNLLSEDLSNTLSDFYITAENSLNIKKYLENITNKISIENVSTGANLEVNNLLGKNTNSIFNNQDLTNFLTNNPISTLQQEPTKVFSSFLNSFTTEKISNVISQQPSLEALESMKGRVDIISPSFLEISGINKVEPRLAESTNIFTPRGIETNRVDVEPMASIRTNPPIQVPQVIREEPQIPIFQIGNNIPTTTQPQNITESQSTSPTLPVMQEPSISTITEKRGDEMNMSNQMLGSLLSQLGALTSVVREISTKLSYLDEDTNLSFK
jgi:hypothetical protein